MLLGPHVKRDANLPQIIDAGNALPSSLRLGKRRQQQSGKYRANRDHYQQLDQREAVGVGSLPS
jgi:hypothetical protein